MIQELKHRDERLAEEMSGVFERAKDRSDKCDFVLVLMQHKEGGIVWESMPSMRVETVIFIATTFLHSFIAEMMGKR